MITPTFHLLSLLFFFISALFIQTHAHGFMKTPRTRGAYKSQKIQPDIPVPQGGVQDYCAHCQNGGGVGAVKAALHENYTPYRSDDRQHAGMCGDKIGNTDHMIGGRYAPFKTAPIVEKYARGAVVDFSVQIDTNHNGFFVFYLCNLDSCGTRDIEQKCFDNNQCSLLKRVASPDCENSSDNFECGPIDTNHPERWYVPCRGGPSNVKGGSEKGSMKYQLPSDVECKHCVVQWYWVTANSCNPKGMKEYFDGKSPFGNSCGGDGGSIGGINPSMVECGGEKFPEEFWGCADVSVGSGNGPSRSSPADSQNDDSEVNNPSAESARTESSVTKTPTPSPSPEATADNPEPEPDLAQPEALVAEDPEPQTGDPTKTPRPSPTPLPSPMVEDSQAELTRDTGNGEPDTQNAGDPGALESEPSKKANDPMPEDREPLKPTETPKTKPTVIIWKPYWARRGGRRKRHYHWFYHW